MPTAIRSFYRVPKCSTRRPTTASAGAGRWPRRGIRSRAKERSSLAAGRFPAESVRRADDGLLRPLLRRQDEDDDTKKNESGTYALQTLGDDETIARLATGIKRFKLPDEFNYIKIYAADRRRAADRLRRTGPRAAGPDLRESPAVSQSGRLLAAGHQGIRPGRQRLPPAAARPDRRQLGPLRADHVRSRPGKGATVDFRFRNGNKVSFEAHAINVAKLLDDVKAYLKTSPSQLDWQKINIGDIGYRLVSENQQQYLGAKVADWELDLKPRPDHVDRRITVTTPLQKAGAYLLTAKMADGNTSRIIVWLDDTAIVKKPLDKGMFYFVADAVTGEPSPRPTSSSSAIGRTQVGNTNQFNLDIANFAEFTDADGQVDRPIPSKTTISISGSSRPRPPAGRFAYLGFTSVWYAAVLRRRVQPDQGLHDHRSAGLSAGADGEVQVLGSARQVRSARYVRLRESELHGRDPQSAGRKGPREGLHGRCLRRHRRRISALGRRHARRLSTDGRQFRRRRQLPRRGIQEAGVRSDGRGPERAGHARRKDHRQDQGEVLLRRAGHQGQGEVQGAADQLLAAVVSARRVGLVLWPGYWWFAYDYAWYPGWRDWGCRRPIPWWWWNRGQEPPEVVADRQVEIGADGTVQVEIDTAARQGDPSRRGPSIRDHGRSGRRIAAHDRRHGQRAGRPQAVQGLRLGRSGLLPRRRRDPRRFLRPDARPQAGRGEGKLDLLEDHLQRRQAGRDGGPPVEPGHRRPGPGQDADQGRRSRANIGCRTN